MRQGTYLNVILTVNAVLLAGLLWTQIADRPTLSGEAFAQSSQTDRAQFLDAGAQRQKMIAVLQEMKTAVEANQKLFEKGRAKVEVTNLDQIRVDKAR